MMIPTLLAHADAVLHIHPETVAIAAVLLGLSVAAVRRALAGKAPKPARKPSA
jgi:hypothetical protein